MLVNIQIDKPAKMVFVIKNRLKPKIRNKGKNNGLPINTPTAIGTNNIPDTSAEYKSPTCNNNGTKKGTPPKPKRDTKFPSTETRKVLKLNRSVLTIGWASRRECII